MQPLKRWCVGRDEACLLGWWHTVVVCLIAVCLSVFLSVFFCIYVHACVHPTTTHRATTHRPTHAAPSQHAPPQMQRVYGDILKGPSQQLPLPPPPATPLKLDSPEAQAHLAAAVDVLQRRHVEGAHRIAMDMGARIDAVGKEDAQHEVCWGVRCWQCVCGSVFVHAISCIVIGHCTCTYTWSYVGMSNNYWC